MNIMRSLIDLGLSPKHKGFAALSFVLSKMSKTKSADISKEYKTICKMRSDSFKTSEQLMRYAIKYAWERPSESLHKLFPLQDNPPTPLEFVLVYCMTYFYDGDQTI